MTAGKKRKYRGGGFGVLIATCVEVSTFTEIEGLIKAFRMTKSGVVRQLVLRGLAEYHRDGKLTALPGIPPAAPTAGYYSDVQE